VRAGTIAMGALAAVVAGGGLYLQVLARQGGARPPPPSPSAVSARGEAPPPVITPARPPAPPPPIVAPPPLPPPPRPAPIAIVEPPPPPIALAPPPLVRTASGLQYQDTRVGTGASPRPGQNVIVHYTGWLDVDGAKGAQFDSSHDRGEPIQISFGKGTTIAGWEEGLASMRIGGQRTLVIPAALGYGDHGAGDAIPPGATLRFEIELIDARDPPALPEASP